MIPHSRPWITDVDKAAINTVIDSGMIAKGELVRRFESDVSKYLGGGVFKVTPSGRSAIILALNLLGVGVGDEVIIPTYICSSVAQAVSFVGATPVLADSGENWAVDAESVSRVVSEKTKVIVVANVFGISADFDGLSQLGVPLIEDNAQSFGLPVSSGAVLSVYSFNATKCLTTAEGGGVLVRDEVLGSQLSSKFLTNAMGGISDLQAALGISQLSRYGDFLERRRTIAEYYYQNIDANLCRRMHQVRSQSMFFRFLLTVEQSVDELIKAFGLKGVAARRGVDALLHRKMGKSDKSYLNAVNRFDRTLSIPILPDIELSEVQHIVNVVKGLC